MDPEPDPGRPIPFDATIVAADRGGAYVAVPAAVVEALGGKKRIPVAATFDGVAYRGSIVSMGGDERILGMLRAIRDELGKGPGDSVAVTVAPDTAPRAVEVPADLAAALDEAGLRTVFDALSYSHRREYVGWIEEAKRSETRSRRVRTTVERVGGAP